MTMEQVYTGVLEKLEKQGLLVTGDDIVRLTKKGIDISNYVFEQFLLS